MGAKYALPLHIIMKKDLSLPPLSHIVTLFREETWDCLRDEFDVYENTAPGAMSVEQLHELIADREAVITGWNAPAFSHEILDAAPHLKIIAHTAGSAKTLLSPELVREVLMPRGIVLFSGNDGLAVNVAEATVGMMISASRRWSEHAEAFGRLGRRSQEIPRNGQFLTGATVGIVAASRVARRVLRLLQPFDCNILL